MNRVDATSEQAPFIRGDGDWRGVVMIERPDPSKTPYGAVLMCRVMSAKVIQLGFRRAIYEIMPYDLFKHLFRLEDGDHIYHAAEFKMGADGVGHLEVYERANRKEWVIFSVGEGTAEAKEINTAYT